MISIANHVDSLTSSITKMNNYLIDNMCYFEEVDTDKVFYE